MSGFYNRIRYLAYFIEISVLYIIEHMPNFIPSINNVKPMLLILVAAVISLFEGKKVGVCFSLLVGLFLDCGSSGSIGFYSITLACMGFIVGYLAQKMIKFNSLIALSIILGATIFVYCTHFLFMYCFKGYPDLWYTLRNHYFVGFTYTIIFSPFVYLFNKAFAVNINKTD